MKTKYSRYFDYFEKGVGAKSIFLFMILLVVSAILLLLKYEKIAEYVANLAYFFLIIGGFIRFIQMLIHF